MLQDEREAWRFLLEQEFGMTFNTFIGPDGSTIGYEHGEKCECAECDTARWQAIEKRETNRKGTGMEHQDFYEGLFLTMERSGQDFRSKQEKLEQEPTTDKVEVAIGQGKTATFYREAGEVLLENEESAFYLDAEETYRLLALLQAELKGSVS
jgi:hypothetical protein